MLTIKTSTGLFNSVDIPAAKTKGSSLLPSSEPRNAPGTHAAPSAKPTTSLAESPRGSRSVRLLLWSGLCFLGLTNANALVFVDLVLVPDTSLYTWRLAVGGVSIQLLVYGLIFEAG